MKVYISVDMEGVACVTHREDLVPEGEGYQLARRWMTAETNAAVLGAFDAGATEVVVSDSHNTMRNLLPDELHEEVLLVRGSPRPLSQMEGLDDTFDAAFLVGYHGMAGTAKSVFPHTFLKGMMYAARLNGVPLGETGISAALAGHFGVPVALVCGDDSVHARVGEFLPWAESVITKWAISELAAKNLTPRASQKRIRAAAARALGRLDEMRPWTPETPVRFELEYLHPVHAYLGAEIPGVEMVDGRTLAYTGADLMEVFRVFSAMIHTALSHAKI